MNLSGVSEPEDGDEEIQGILGDLCLILSRDQHRDHLSFAERPEKPENQKIICPVGPGVLGVQAEFVRVGPSGPSSRGE
jgi:hypothetical protein